MENIKDKIHVDLSLIENEKCNHYSREYLVENGIKVTVEAMSKSDSDIQNGSSSAFVAILFAALIGGLLLGSASGYLFKKYQTKKLNLPSMSYKNPNLDFSSMRQ